MHSIAPPVVVAVAVLICAACVEGFTAHSTIAAQQPPLRFFNSFSRSKQVFQPQDPKRVTFYSCGPTLYDHVHIGNLRAFITYVLPQRDRAGKIVVFHKFRHNHNAVVLLSAPFVASYDIVKRWLQFAGYSVEHVCNLTDVDDKIIRKAQAEKTSAKDIAYRYATTFFEDLALLNVLPATKDPRATDHIADILRIIDVLVKKGHAYERNGSVYFRTSSFPGYGTFGGLRHSCPGEAANGAAAAATTADDEKEDPRDFALWKAAKESDEGCAWQSPYGKGRPGWHIECSAMCQTLLGETVDIHAGGADLQFPHHHNEMVQSEAATGKQFCKYWLHNGFLTVGDAQGKMSKSFGGFQTLRDVVRIPLQARAFRHFVVSSHYRAPLHFNNECIVASANALTKMDKLLSVLQAARQSRRNAASKAAATQDVRAVCDKAMARFASSMSDDMHTPTAITALHTLCNEVEKSADTLGTADAEAVLSTIYEMDKVFGLFYEVPEIGPFQDYRARDDQNRVVDFDNLPVHVQRLINERTRAKQEGKFELADQLRHQLQEQGYQLIDSKAGTQILHLPGQ